MAEVVRLVDPNTLVPNPENPRLIFRSEELEALQDSIAQQGILVPLTVFQDGKGQKLVLLDGERRWRCALKLALPRVPVIVQPKPTKLQNLMMMFHIHNARKDWDPLPTAYKLADLEAEFKRTEGRTPTEGELAGLASLDRGEIRRLRNLLGLPESYRAELMEELEKPRSQQILTVDHVLEATRGAAALRKRDVIDADQEDQLRRAIIDKFKSGVIGNTVAPRQLARIARGVEREEVPTSVARQVVAKIIRDPKYTIANAFSESVAQADFDHAFVQLVDRTLARIDEYSEGQYELTQSAREALQRLYRAVSRVLKS